MFFFLILSPFHHLLVSRLNPLAFFFSFFFPSKTASDYELSIPIWIPPFPHVPMSMWPCPLGHGVFSSCSSSRVVRWNPLPSCLLFFTLAFFSLASQFLQIYFFLLDIRNSNLLSLLLDIELRFDQISVLMLVENIPPRVLDYCPLFSFLYISHF